MHQPRRLPVMFAFQLFDFYDFNFYIFIALLFLLASHQSGALLIKPVRKIFGSIFTPRNQVGETWCFSWDQLMVWKPANFDYSDYPSYRKSRHTEDAEKERKKLWVKGVGLGRQRRQRRQRRLKRSFWAGPPHCRHGFVRSLTNKMGELRVLDKSQREFLEWSISIISLYFKVPY